MRILMLALAGALFLTPIVQPLEAQQAPRFGYIDSQAILDESPGAREAQADWEREMERYRAEIERMGRDLDRLITQYQQQQATLDPEARQIREDEIRRRQMEYERRVNEMEAEADEVREGILAPIFERMSNAIDQIREEGNYALIFDVAAGSIIAADPALDLTDEVIRRLRENAQNDDR